MSTRQQVGNKPIFGTAAGYANPMGNDQGYTPFYRTCVRPLMLDSFRCSTFVDEVTSKRLLQGTVKTGVEAEYMRTTDPEVFSGYDDNSEFASPSTPKAAVCKIRLGYNAYTHEKIDDRTLNRMVNGGKSIYLADRSKKHGEVLAQKHQNDFLCWLGSQVHACNEGKTAGVVSGGIDLGTPDSPFVMNPVNSLALATLLNQALDEHNLPQGNRRMIVPTAIRTQLQLSVGRAIANTGRGIGEYLNGLCAGMDMLPCGDNMYVTNCLLPIKNASGQLVYPVYYMWKEAIDSAYNMDDELSGIFESDRTRSHYRTQRDFIVYGFHTLYCQGVARAWVTIDPNWMDKLPGRSCV